MNHPEPVRLWLWRADGSPAGELVLAPGQPRPTVIALAHPTGSIQYWRDSRDANMYRERQLTK